MGNMPQSEVVSLAFRAEGDYAAVFTFADGPREFASLAVPAGAAGLTTCWPTETFSGGSVWPSR